MIITFSFFFSISFIFLLSFFFLFFKQVCHFPSHARPFRKLPRSAEVAFKAPCSHRLCCVFRHHSYSFVFLLRFRFANYFAIINRWWRSLWLLRLIITNKLVKHDVTCEVFTLDLVFKTAILLFWPYIFNEHTLKGMVIEHLTSFFRYHNVSSAPLYPQVGIVWLLTIPQLV